MAPSFQAIVTTHRRSAPLVNVVFVAAILAGGLFGMYTRDPRPTPGQIERYVAVFVATVLVVVGLRWAARRRASRTSQ